MSFIVCCVKEAPMKKIALAIFLFTWAVLLFSAQMCQNEVNSLVRADPWGRLANDLDVDFRIRPLGVHQVSSRTRKAMEQLERAGGKGRYA